ncbi:hypothetical protein [Nocardiopsis baichengensis]|uniref:hypothetical protein n=1 Tax=Nocardiopsis baichengensis TaxID=280240 RepID=UPI0012684CBC|nr:hypothetical protein [Nocardiopsis baichengensis]
METTYEHWGQVPGDLYTKRALEGLEHPRRPAGRPSAWVESRDWRDRRIDVELYRLEDTEPTAATAAQLRAAAARSSRVRTCSDCGARCDRDLAPHPDRAEQVPLCRTCLRIARLRERQALLAERRPEAVEWARGLAADGAAALWLDRVRPPREPGARLPAAVAVLVEAAGPVRARVAVRLAGARNPHVPEGAVAVQEAAQALRGLSSRPVVVWDEEQAGHLQVLATRLAKAGVGPGWGRVCQASGLVSTWRGELDPDRPRGRVPAVAPGRADRLAELLERIAADGDRP